MARSGGVLGWVQEQAEERLGMALLPKERAEFLQESLHQFQEFRDEVTDFMWNQVGSGSTQSTGVPKLNEEQRRSLALRSRNALAWDPLAGAEANLLANFSFGRGVPLPQAKDDAVQEVIREAWEDPLNESKLTGFDAQRYRSNQMLTDANLYPVSFVAAGRVRVAFRDADDVKLIITDPEDDERPLWYQVKLKPRRRFNFAEDKFPDDEVTPDQQKDIKYVAHYRNWEDFERERDGEEVETQSGEKQEAWDPPEEDRRGPGRMAHFRINRVGRTEFGTPPWARTLSWMEELNRVQRAHGAMAQAASTLIAKRVLGSGGAGTDLTKAAQGVLNRTGELAVAERGGLPRAGLPPPPGSVRLENESDRLESLKLDSGAGQVGQTTQILRAPIAAPTGFGQHYFGDAQNAGSLAAATSVELPGTMTIQAWQEMMAQLLRWFVDEAIEAALRAGRLGGVGKLEKDAPGAKGLRLTELRLREGREREEAERRTEKDLSYELTMPYPGRRNLPDVTGSVTSAVAGFDPYGDNDPLRKAGLEFLFAHGWQLENPAELADEVVKSAKAAREKAEKKEAEAAEKAEREALALAGRDPNAVGGEDGDTASVSGEKRKAGEPADEMGTAVAEAARRVFLEEVEGPLLASPNGGDPA